MLPLPKCYKKKHLFSWDQIPDVDLQSAICLGLVVSSSCRSKLQLVCCQKAASVCSPCLLTASACNCSRACVLPWLARQCAHAAWIWADCLWLLCACAVGLLVCRAQALQLCLWCSPSLWSQCGSAGKQAMTFSSCGSTETPPWCGDQKLGVILILRL